MSRMEDTSGNIWFKQEKHEERLNHAVRGAHAVIPFQCEDCWMLNLEGRLPVAGLDDMYIMLIRRANLDAIAGRATTTIEAHANQIKRTVANCALFGKTPSIPARGPMPLKDNVGMGLAVEMEFLGLTVKGKIKPHAQWDSVRKPRSTNTKAWESSPLGIAEGFSFAKGMSKASFTTCPTQSDWFAHFCIGAETRIGFATQANKPIHIKVVLRVLELIKEEVVDQPWHLAKEMWKLGAAMATAQSGSLRGPEVFMLDLMGLKNHIELGRNGIMPEDPLNPGTDLFNAPHVHIALIGKFKGETGIREHLIAVASESMSGLKTRWWLEKLLEVRAQEGSTHGPAFGHSNGTLATMAEYDAMLHYFLAKVQDEANDLIMAGDDIKKNYRLFRSFRKSAEGRARAAGLDSDMQNTMNRWKKIESARGRRPRFNMVDHYSNVRDLMPVTWRYAYVQ